MQANLLTIANPPTVAAANDWPGPDEKFRFSRFLNQRHIAYCVPRSVHKTLHAVICDWYTHYFSRTDACCALGNFVLLRPTCYYDRYISLFQGNIYFLMWSLGDPVNYFPVEWITSLNCNVLLSALQISRKNCGRWASQSNLLKRIQFPQKSIMIKGIKINEKDI